MLTWSLSQRAINDGRKIGIGLCGCWCLVIGVLPAMAQEFTKVDVPREVWPILREHCLPCHGGDSIDGDLRLDQIDAIRAGGHTGREILGRVDDSELLRRIRAADPGYRMPKEAEPLSQAEIATLARWIEQGAPWPENESLVTDLDALSPVLTPLTAADDRTLLPNTQRPESWASWLSRQLDVVSVYQEAMRPLMITFLAFCLLVLIIERFKRRNLTDTSLTRHWSQRVRYSHYALVLLGFLWVGTVLYFGVQEAKLQQKHDNLAQQLASQVHWEPAFNSTIDEQVGPFRPPHPPQMGGTYYRGNDERNEHLFNGGYYATAIMHVSLRDRNNHKLDWGDTIDPNTLVVCLELQRAPYATPQLFEDKGLTSCYLRLAPEDGDAAQSVAPTQPREQQKSSIQIVESGERWQACYPLHGLAKRDGDVSRYVGGIDVCVAGGRPHYGIRYDIAVRDGRIEPDSELWMGATFLTSKVVVPKPGNIPLREWFDFVPIPEITRENSSDPELLGIIEHQRQGSGFATVEGQDEADPPPPNQTPPAPQPKPSQPKPSQSKPSQSKPEQDAQSR